MIDIPVFVNSNNRVLGDENEFRMRNVEFTSIGRADFKWAKSAAADSLF